MKNLTFFALFFVLAGCIKDGKNIHVEGKVIDPITQKAIPGVKIRLIKKSALGGGGAPGWDSGSSSKQVGESTSDIAGKFDIWHKGGVSKHYLNSYPTPYGYHKYGWSDENKASKVLKGKTTTVDLYLLKKQKIHEKILNVNCEGATDTLILKRRYLEPWDPYEKYKRNYRLFGCYHYDNLEEEILQGTWLYSWEVHRPSGITEGSQYVEVGEGTNEFFLEY